MPAGNEIINRLFARNSTMETWETSAVSAVTLQNFVFIPHFHSKRDDGYIYIYLMYNRLEIYSVCYYLSIYASFARRNFDVIGDSKRVVIPRFCFGLGN